MMTTYELIKRLVQVDPTGQRPVMLSINTKKGDRSVEINGFIDEIWVEYPEEAETPFTILSGTDA